MNILLLGSGGREHVLAWKIAQSQKCTRLYIAPGNAGTQSHGINVSLDVNDFEGIRNFVLGHNINMVIVGPEDPLVNGIHDYFLADGNLCSIPVIGPTKEAARLEGSKAFSKEFMILNDIPTAKAKTFNSKSLHLGLYYLENLSPPYVLKADGLAAGKGVVICHTLEEAQDELKAMINDAKFGEAGSNVVIEEFLKGKEFSVFILTDGITYKILPIAKDYKRIGEKDTGLNTGGMGAVSPVPFVDDALMKKVENEIIIPTMNGLKKAKISYSGFLYFGLICVNDNPFVIEFNVRLGDPEAQAVLPRINNDIIELFECIPAQTLGNCFIEQDPRNTAAIVLASGGYPGKYDKGKTISGFDRVENSIIFHAGTKINEKNEIITSGGRVLAVTSFGNNLPSALKLSYDNAGRIDFEGKHYRKDIGFDVV